MVTSLVGTLVIVRQEIPVENEEPLKVGDFGMVIEDYSKALDVWFLGRSHAIDVNSAYVRKLNTDDVKQRVKELYSNG